MYEFMNLQLFDAVQSVTNTTTGDVNSYTGAANATGALSATMKTYYDTELLENTRETLIFAQLGKKQTLPANHGKIVEWRKWNTLGDVSRLTEGVIPVGKKLGQTSQTVEIAQYGDYVSISDQLELHALDDTILGATEELGAASAKTYDKLERLHLGYFQALQLVLYTFLPKVRLPCQSQSCQLQEYPLWLAL